MMSFFKASALRTLMVVLLSVTALCAQAQVTASDDGKSWTVNIRNADIQAFISQIADMTGKNFVVDPRVRARDVTVVSTKALTAAEVYELFLSVLQVHGYAAVPSGDIIKIVPNTTAKQSNLPLVGRDESGGEELLPGSFRWRTHRWKSWYRCYGPWCPNTAIWLRWARPMH